MTDQKRRRPRYRRFLFEPERLDTDPAVEAMTTLEAFGAYCHLFLAGWDRPDPGVWPDNDRLLAAGAKANHDEWQRVRSEVSRCFDTTSRPGFWVQRGTVRTLESQDRYADRQRARGKLGAKARWGNEMNGTSMAHATSTLSPGHGTDMALDSGSQVLRFSGEEEPTPQSQKKKLPKRVRVRATPENPVRITEAHVAKASEVHGLPIEIVKRLAAKVEVATDKTGRPYVNHPQTLMNWCAKEPKPAAQPKSSLWPDGVG